MQKRAKKMRPLTPEAPKPGERFKKKSGLIPNLRALSYTWEYSNAMQLALQTQKGLDGLDVQIFPEKMSPIPELFIRPR